MTTEAQLKEAKALIEEARALGVKPGLSGNFVTWEGNLPVPLLMRSIPLADAIADVLTAENKDCLQ